jgi:hypothetical protein
MSASALAFLETVSPVLEAVQDTVAALGMDALMQWFCVWPAPVAFLGLMYGPILPMAVGSYIGAVCLTYLPIFV